MWMPWYLMSDRIYFSLALVLGVKEMVAYPGLEAGNLLVGESVRLGNDRDQVDLGVKSSHDLNVQRLQ